MFTGGQRCLLRPRQKGARAAGGAYPVAEEQRNIEIVDKVVCQVHSNIQFHLFSLLILYKHRRSSGATQLSDGDHDVRGRANARGVTLHTTAG